MHSHTCLFAQVLAFRFVVAEEVEGASVELVGSALGLVEDVAAEDVAVFSRSVGRDDLHLADGVDAGVVARDVVESLVDVHTVEQVLVGLLAVAVDGDGLVGADWSGDRALLTKPLGLVLTAPGRNIVRAMMLRQTSGMFSMARVSSVVERTGLSVLISGAISASTETFCCWLSRASLASTLAFWPVSKREGAIGRRFAKPGAVTRYLVLADLEEADVVDTVVVGGGFGDDAGFGVGCLTLAFGMTAPDGSVTIPFTPPVIVCAQVAAEHISNMATAMILK